METKVLPNPQPGEIWIRGLDDLDGNVFLFKVDGPNDTGGYQGYYVPIRLGINEVHWRNNLVEVESPEELTQYEAVEIIRKANLTWGNSM